MINFPLRLSAFSNQVLAWLEGVGINWKISFLVVMGLWVVHFVNFCFSYRLNRWGIVPRTARGLIGILLAPFLHADSGHLFFNSIPLFVLLSVLFVHGWYYVLLVTWYLMLIGGGLLWVIGKRGVHIGASGLIMGYIGYMLANAYFRPSTSNVLAASIVLLYFGSSLLSVLPWSNKRVSWQGHLTGLLSGVILVILGRL